MQRFSVTFQKYVKLMQRLSGFKGKDIFNMNSKEGSQSYQLIDDLSQLSLRPMPVPKYEWSPEPERPDPSLPSLLTDIFSGTSCESFDEGYSHLRLPILGSISVAGTMK